MSDQNTSLPLEFPTGAPARKETMSSLVVTHKALIADLETLNDPFDGEPANAVRASLTVNPTGTNNSIDYTAVAYGADGNAVSVAYTAPVQGELEVSVADSAITVACGTKHRMIVTGTLTSDGSNPVSFPTMNHNGEFHGSTWWAATDPEYELFTSEGVLILSDGATGATWESTADVAYPDLVPAGSWNADTNPDAWKPVAPATGTPVVTAALPTAQQVIDAVEASEEATALVTVAANGTVTGAVAAVAAANLSGGVDGTPGKRGRLANDDESIWYCMSNDFTTQNHGWIKLGSAS